MPSAFLAPTSVDEALEALAGDHAPTVIAGGTDLWPGWAAGAPKPERLLSLHRLGELRRIELDDAALTLRIGATCTHADLVRSEAVRSACPSLAEAAGTIGAAQVQNRGTIGGNLANASPAADLPPPLAAAGARVELASAGGRREVPLSRFFTGYRQLDRREDELLVAVVVPCLPDGARERFRKVGTRRAQAISKVVGSCRLQLDAGGAIASIGIAFGSVAPTVVRLGELEGWLAGRRVDEDLAEEAARRAGEEVTPIDDLRSSADYRRHVVARLVHGFLLP